MLRVDFVGVLVFKRSREVVTDLAVDLENLGLDDDFSLLRNLHRISPDN